jgi:DNA-binding response OmpR family regulator
MSSSSLENSASAPKPPAKSWLPTQPDYASWTKAQLLERVLELEAELRPGTSLELIERIPIQLTPRECEVLALLYSHAPKFLRTSFVADILGLPSDELLKVFICKLRKKLSPHGLLIDTCYGRGYRLSNPERVKELL